MRPILSLAVASIALSVSFATHATYHNQSDTLAHCSIMTNASGITIVMASDAQSGRLLETVKLRVDASDVVTYE